jgi:hypothetical protein
MTPIELSIFAPDCVGLAGALFIRLLVVAASRSTSSQRVDA